MFKGKISNPLTTWQVGVPELQQLHWLQLPALPGPLASTRQDHQPAPHRTTGCSPHPCQHPQAATWISLLRGTSCSLSTGAGHAASLAVCLSAEVSDIPFNVNISSKAFHFLTHNTFPDYGDLLLMFPDPKSFPFSFSFSLPFSFSFKNSCFLTLLVESATQTEKGN